jgi:hypothetical protein
VIFGWKHVQVSRNCDKSLFGEHLSIFIHIPWGVDTFLGTPFFGVRSLKMRSSCDQATKGHSFGHRAANFLANLRKKAKHFPSDFWWWCQVCLKMGCIPPGCGQLNRENDYSSMDLGLPYFQKEPSDPVIFCY